MDLDLEDAPSVHPWDLFALAACEPLRGRPGVHVAPDIPVRVLTGAMSRYLSLEPGELLLVIVDRSGGSRPDRGYALTTRRVCRPGRGADSSEAAGVVPTSEEDATSPANRGRSATSSRYESLPDPVPVVDDDGLAIDLGHGLRLPIPGMERAAAGAIAGVLTTLRRALSSGDLAGSAPPEHLNRARRLFSTVRQQSAAVRQVTGEVLSFHDAAQRATPRVFVTRAMILACSLIYVAMILTGVSPFDPDGRQLLAWGANLGARFAVQGEAWRLLTAVFLHGGLLHLAVNMWCLSRIGPLVERLYGPFAFAWMYLGSGIGGFLASAWFHPLTVSVGASGAIFGVIGGLGAFLLMHRTRIPISVLGPLRGGVLSFVVYNTLFGALIPGIDNAAHLGGLATGFAAGMLLTRPWPMPRAHVGMVQQLFGGAVLGLAVAVVGIIVAGEIRSNPEVRVLEAVQDEMIRRPDP